jgi:amino acid adenylation domain-containing protein
VSFAQQRLWFLEQLTPGNPFYNEHTSIRFTFALNAAVLAQCLDEIVCRHDSLRTTFTEVDGEPVQVIAATGSASLPVVDLRYLPADERSAAAIQVIAEDVGRPFDLEHGPLIRTRLVRVDEADYLFVVTLHHIVSDGWSLGILGRELQALYGALATGRPSPLPPLPVQYGDFAVWQRRRLQGPTLEAHLAYWKKQLAGAPALELPTDHPRPAIPSFRGGAHARVYSPELLAALRALANEEGATLFMMLLAGFDLLLSRYSGQNDIVVGVPVANRDRVELESVIGFFVNTLVMRTRIGDGMTVRQLVARVRTTAIDAYAHQDLPFERLVEELQPRRDLSRNPVFQVVFQLFAAPGNGVLRAVLPSLEAPATTSKFDLTVHLTECAEGLYARFEYSTDLFDPPTIERLAEHYGGLLVAMTATPDVPAAVLPFLSDRERRWIVAELNATSSAYPHNRGLQELFEAQVARTPDAVAVRFDGVALSYGELDRRANALAATLRTLGVGPDVPVAVAVERSTEMVVAVVAVIKAGGAYVPIDPLYPPARIAFMLQDTRAAAVLTQSRLLPTLPSLRGHLICLDKETEEQPFDCAAAVPGGAGAANLAYIMYTSGSTGVPKGVAVEQRSIARLVLETNYIRLDASDRIAQVSNFSFDAATFEIWGALLNGATLVGIRHDVALHVSAFAQELREQRITAMFLTAALLRHVAAEVPDAFAILQTLIFGGDSADPQSVAAVLRDGPPARLLNGYGPTECTTFATWHEVRAVPPDAVTIPIGQPIANTEVYVLDAHGELVPPSVIGELYLGGDGLARGYWNDPTLTAARFVPHPFSPVPGARLYRTGDRVRLRADGNLECLGRFDHQVKIRGFRVEPGEIEVALRAHADVREALVMVREDRPGDRRLVAYAVAEGGPARALELRRALQERLPDYMVPSIVVCVGAMPLTPNGKVDRSRLPAPDGAAAFSPSAAPSTELERTIANIWCETLNIMHAGVHDNFFELGGHSLLLAKVHSRLRAALAREVSMMDLFRFPTVHSLAAHLAGSEPERPLLGDIEDRAARQRRRLRSQRPTLTKASASP